MLLSPDTIESLHDDKGLRNAIQGTSAAKNALQFVSQGLCDLQINGFAGIDYNDPTARPDQIEQSLRAMLSTGVTRCLPTIITASLDWQQGCIAALEAARESSPLVNAMIAGYHLEGPFLNPEPGYSGCHPAQHMIAGNLDYVQRLQSVANGQIKLVTLAPEVPGVMDMIAPLSKQGICVAVGHSAADYSTLQQALDSGARMSTHLGNGTAPLLAKSDNTILSQLSLDGLSAGFIADDYHVRRHVLGVYLRAKQSANTVLVTDGTAGSYAPPGQYTLGKLAIERQQEPVVYQPGTTSLAGSATTLDRCVSNVCQWYGTAPDTAIDWAAKHARRLINLSDTPVAGEKLEWVWWEKSDDGLKVTKVQLGDVCLSV